MVAVAQRPGISARQVGIRAGLSSKSGTFSTYLGDLRSRAWLEGDRESLRLTAAGVEALGDYDPLPSGHQLFEHWLDELGRGSGASRMLAELVCNYPDPLSKTELGIRAQISSTSGTFSTYLGKLRALELVTGTSELLPSRELFD